MAHLTRILCMAEPRGSAAVIGQLLESPERLGVQAIAVVGDLGAGPGLRASYRALFRALGNVRLPAFWVPGPGDAPIVEYLRESHKIEVVFPALHGVHGTAALGPGEVIFAGVGGEISDDPGAERDEVDRVRLPRWEPEYRLKLLREMPEHERVLLFATPPVHKGLGTAGSDVVAELVGTYRPRLVVCGGPSASESLGRSLVVAPGSAAEGHYAIVDLPAHSVELEELSTAAGA
jgi:Icc-related predicted phosphoesterase